jgi:hypothetical protein
MSRPYCDTWLMEVVRGMSRPYVIILLVLLLAGCAAPVVQADPAASTPTATVALTPTVTVTPTSTPVPTLTSTPTPIPTISIPILTRTITPTVAPTLEAAPLPPLDELPDGVIPYSFGVEIHFTRADAYELDRLAAGGFRWVRMDLFWHAVEIEPGRYDFSAYDALVASMARRGIRIVFILDYGNPMYDNGFPPTSAEGRAAFARFAATAVRHYRGKGIVWEIWNEPNLNHFWVPEANAAHYGQLALETVAAIRRVDPTALIVAPATSGFDPPYWTALGEMGLFDRLDAVTVHPYGIETPEGVGPFYVQLTGLLHRFSPAWKIPILSGEWGYASVVDGLSEGQQAQYLARQWLVNLAYDVNLSIWYDWRDDGMDRTDLEQNFGTVHHDFSPKPTYRAARALLTTLDGYRFMRRIPLETSDDYLLLFQKELRVAMAIWTTGEAHTVILPISVDDVKVVEMLGDVDVLPSEGGGLAVPISQSPRYLMFRADQAASWLGGWRPYDSVQCFQPDDDGGVRVVFNDVPGPLFGELQVRVGDAVRGSALVSVKPMEEEHVRVPVNLAGLRGGVPAELAFIPADEVMLALQKAAIWLCVGDGR